MCVCVCVCVCACARVRACVHPRGYKLHSHDIEFVQLVEQVCCVVFRNITKLSMHGRGLCNEARCDRNQSSKAMLAP